MKGNVGDTGKHSRVRAEKKENYEVFVATADLKNH